ncbi:MAG: PTS sugar transporter subunit IIA [Atopobiaceae bacterium]|nr:PTS sugar transporter subunit IIA [Atopobiaceae bacterium]MDO4404383.1 fructose PTS transporter subunit IIA [Atopobiaceae bacterium]
MSEYIKTTQVFLDNPATTVDEALNFFAKKAVELGISDDEAGCLAAFNEREAMGTTGMQGGFAIPHCKSTVVKDAAILVAKFANDIDWNSLDGRPVKVAVALFAPDGDVHLTLLSTVAGMLTDESFRSKLLAAADAEAVAGVINHAMSN